MALFLLPESMGGYLASRCGPPTSCAQGQRLFNLLGLRGMLKPWINGFWELETIAEEDWPALIGALPQPPGR